MPKTMPKTPPKTAAPSPPAPSPPARAFFEAGLAVGQRVYLRFAYEGVDGNGNRQYARPGATADIETITAITGDPSNGRWFHCKLHVRRTVASFEKTVKDTVSFRADQLCAKPREAEIV